MRAFYANGVEKIHITRVIGGLPTLLHLSLFLFFRTGHLSIQYQSHGPQLRGLVDRAFFNHLWIDYNPAN